MAGKCVFLCNEICDMITSGKLTPGAQAPSENELLSTYGLSYTTIKSAYNRLAEQGIITRRRGSGTYVSEKAPELLDGRLNSSFAHPGIARRAVHVLVKDYDAMTMSLEDRTNHFIALDIMKGINDVLINVRVPYYAQNITDDGAVDLAKMNPNDGVVIIHGRTAANINALKSKHIPFVVVNYPASFVCDFGVEADDASGVHEAVAYLARQGCGSVAYLGPVDNPRYHPRLTGFRHGVSDFQMKGVEIACDSLAKKDIEKAIGKSLSSAAPPPRAIIAATDYLAIACMAILKEKGIAVPDKVGVIGFDDSPDAPNSHPPLTTIRKPRSEMGREAVLMLLELFKKPNSEFFKKVLKTTLVIRGSAILN